MIAKRLLSCQHEIASSLGGSSHPPLPRTIIKPEPMGPLLASSISPKSFMHLSFENQIQRAWPRPAATGSLRPMVATVASTETSAPNVIPYGQSGIGCPLKATRTPTIAAVATRAISQANHSTSHRSITARRNRLRLRGTVFGFRCVLSVSNCGIALLDVFSRLFTGVYEAS